MSGLSTKDDRFGLETSLKTLDWTLDPITQDRLLDYVALLRKWQRAQNLVGPDTLADVWSRHIVDCLQLVPLLEKEADRRGLSTPHLVDLGSGGGLPGLVLAIAMAVRTKPVSVTLIEANSRKASFLRTVSRETNVNVDVVNSRIEQAVIGPADFVTARALAPLDKLVHLAEPWLQGGASAFFHKGGESSRELAEWTAAEDYDVVNISSIVDPMSCVLHIRKQDAD